MNKYNQLLNELEILNNKLLDKQLSNYDRNKLQNELISLRRRPLEKPTFQPSLRTQVRINELQKSLSARSLLFSGYLTIYQIVDPSLPEVRQLYQEIENFMAQNQPRPSVYNINK
jgi:hypothetical protein